MIDDIEDFSTILKNSIVMTIERKKKICSMENTPTG